MDIKGHTVEVVLVEPACDIAAEYYASFTFDRSARLHLGLLSAQGGVDIEEVAPRDPEAVARVHVDPLDGLSDDAAADLAARAGLDGRGRGGRGRAAAQAVTRPTWPPTPTWWRSTPWS